MSANGAISTTLDYEFFGGGYVQNSGVASSTFEVSLDSSGRVPIVGEISPFNLDFTFSAGIESPIIYGTATGSFDFQSSGFIEFGVQRYANVEWGALLVPFEASAEGYSVVSGALNKTLEFTLDTNIYVFSDGDGEGTFGFTLDGYGLNISTREYSRIGSNDCLFNGNDFNDLKINVPSNAVRIIDNGIRNAVILQK